MILPASLTFQSLQGTIQTRIVIVSPPRRHYSFNPFKVRSKHSVILSWPHPDSQSFNPFKVRSKRAHPGRRFIIDSPRFNPFKVRSKPRYKRFQNFLKFQFQSLQGTIQTPRPRGWRSAWRQPVSIPSRYDPNANGDARWYGQWRVSIPSRYDPNHKRYTLHQPGYYSFNPFKVRSKRF